MEYPACLLVCAAMEVATMDVISFWPFLGFFPYFAQKKNGRSGIVSFEIWAIYWKLTVRKKQNGELSWTFNLPILEKIKALF
jgi:hypothetical protein